MLCHGLLQSMVMPVSTVLKGMKFLRNFQNMINAKFSQKSFWNCWRRQYLQALQKRGKTFHSKTTTQLSVGQVVLINDTPAPRNMWRIGRIVELKATRSVKPNESAPIPRSALIRTSEGLIRRSVRSIAPMECEENPHILQE